MKNIIKKIHLFSQKHCFINESAPLIVGLSGGADSVFLIHALKAMAAQQNIPLIAAHLDHGWRPDSADDLLFCRDLAKNLGIPFVTSTLEKESAGIKFNGSSEEIARKARRRFFERIAHKHGANQIALAHHQDDQQETFFIRLLRGASLTGLTGMKPQDGMYVRPLLCISKAEILTYLTEHEIPYREDPSNQDPAFLRNRIRNTVIPALRSCDNRFAHSFAATLNRLQETEQLLESLTHETIKQISSRTDGIITIDTAQLCALPIPLRSRVLIHWLTDADVTFSPTQAFLDEIVRFLDSPRGGTHQVCPGWEMVKKRKNVVIHIRLSPKVALSPPKNNYN